VERLLLPEGQTPFRPDPVAVPRELAPPTTAAELDGVPDGTTSTTRR
jgi:hypothetical protein